MTRIKTMCLLRSTRKAGTPTPSVEAGSSSVWRHGCVPFALLAACGKNHRRLGTQAKPPAPPWQTNSLRSPWGGRAAAPFALLICLSLVLSGETQQPLPDPNLLRKRSRAGLLQSEKDLEKYSCTVLQKTQELNDDQSVKKERSTLKERFYVNGVQLEHVLARNGEPLKGREARKEQEHVDNDVKRFSDPKQAIGEIDRSEKQEDLFLRAVRFTNGHRETRFNRSLVVYDLSGDPSFHPHKLEEKFAVAVVGRIWIDEETGQPVEIQFRTDKDIKIAGGLFANLHKGFQLHIIRQRQPDGVWLTKSVDGSGEARAVLFFHPRFRFSEDVSRCHLFSVETQQKVEAPK